MFIPLATIYAQAEILAPYTADVSNAPEKLKDALVYWHVAQYSTPSVAAPTSAECIALHIVGSALAYLQEHDGLPSELPLDLGTLRIMRAQDIPVADVTRLVRRLTNGCTI